MFDNLLYISLWFHQPNFIHQAPQILRILHNWNDVMKNTSSIYSFFRKMHSSQIQTSRSFSVLLVNFGFWMCPYNIDWNHDLRKNFPGIDRDWKNLWNLWTTDSRVTTKNSFFFQNRFYCFLEFHRTECRKLYTRKSWEFLSANKLSTVRKPLTKLR